MTRTESWTSFDDVDIEGAARGLAGVVHRTPLVPLPSGDPRIELRAKLENRQEIGAFKARGAWNQVRLLDPRQRARGVVACSSGNHGKALSWAARRAGVPATIVMPENAYANKIQACRDFGAQVVLAPDRESAEARCAALVEEGLTLVHPYDAARTVAGAGTVGREIAEDWPAVELAIFPVGGGGLVAGSSLALRRALGTAPTILGAEPAGSATMTVGLEAGRPVTLAEIRTEVQGLCPLDSGALNIAICRTTLDGVVQLEDEEIFSAQARLVRGGEIVEPAGAAAAAVVFGGHVPAGLLEGRSERDPLRTACVISGANADPAQLERLRGDG